MPNIPTLPEIRDRMFADVAHYLPGSGNRPYKSVLSVIITVFAGAVWSLYGFASWMLKQLDPLTANEKWLQIWGDRLGVPRIHAVSARGTVTFAGAEYIPSGTLLQKAKNQYVVLQDGFPGEALLVEAVEPGYEANIPTAATLTLVSPIAGVELTVTSSPITGGADEEALQAWSQRINEHLKKRQQIGDADDYAGWAREAHTAIRDAWVIGNTPSLGDICIYCLLDPQVDSETVLAEAKTRLDRIRNVGGAVHLRVPASVPITVRFGGIEQVDTQTKITTAVAELITSKRLRSAYLYPEEIERIAANYSSEYVLLAPVAKIQASDTQVLNLTEVLYE